jgi:hypothetical protein
MMQFEHASINIGLGKRGKTKVRKSCKRLTVSFLCLECEIPYMAK